MDHESTNTTGNRAAAPPDSAAGDHGHWSGHVWRAANVCFSAMAWSSLLAIVWAIVPELYEGTQQLAFIENSIVVLCVIVLLAGWCGLCAAYVKARADLVSRRPEGGMRAFLDYFLPALYGVVGFLLACVLALLVAFVMIGESGSNGPLTQAATVRSEQHPADEAVVPSLAAQCCCCCCPGAMKRDDDGSVNEHPESSRSDDCARDASASLHFEEGVPPGT